MTCDIFSLTFLHCNYCIASFITWQHQKPQRDDIGRKSKESASVLTIHSLKFIIYSLLSSSLLPFCRCSTSDELNNFQWLVANVLGTNSPVTRLVHAFEEKQPEQWSFQFRPLFSLEKENNRFRRSTTRLNDDETRIYYYKSELSGWDRSEVESDLESGR